MDFYSTWLLDPSAEENALVKSVWERFGDIGLLVFNVIAVLLIILISEFALRYFKKQHRKQYLTIKAIIIVSLLFASAATFMVAFANLGSVIAYDITTLFLGA